MAYQYKLTWSEVDDETVPQETGEIDNIKKGDRFYCKKTVVMHLDNDIAYTEGKTYVSEKDGCITNDQGLIEHLWDGERWPDFFIPAPHPVEKCSCDKCKQFKETKDYFQSMQEEYGPDKRTFDTGAVRDSNEGKPHIHNLLGYTRQRFGYHMAKNAKKYGPLNFLKGIPTEAALESLDRHLAAYMAGDRSEDHLAALIFNTQCCMLNEKREEGIEANHYFKK